ncbi:signal peptidase II [bacterium]|nr:signal peptidase II [bacterium]
MHKKMANWFCLAVFFIAIDRFFKILALKGIEANIIGDFFRFSLAKNYYIAFSLPITGIMLNILIIIIILLLGFIIINLAKKDDLINVVLLTILEFGAISNLFDRFKYGYVVDYFDLDYFTVFNLADIMIVCGALILVYNLIKNKNIK